MNNKIKLICILIVLLLMVGGSGCNRVTRSSKFTSDGNLKIYTTIYTLQYFTQEIGRERVEVINLIPSGAEAHDWEPSAKTIANLSKADILIYNGLGMEPWLSKITNTLKDYAVNIVEASKNIESLCHDEEHDHEEDHEEDHDHDHDHGAYDPHVWLDPKMAIKQCQVIAEAMMQSDVENADFYFDNLQDLIERLSNLDKEYEQELSKFEDKKVVVAHEAYSYLAQRYALEQIAISGLSPHDEPSAKRLTEIKQIIKNNDIKYIFFDSLVSSKVAKVLADEANIDTLVLNPLEGLTKKEVSNKEDYFTIMEKNLTNLKRALGD